MSTGGLDGALWFTNNGNNSIGRITTTGTVTNFTGAGISHPAKITAGPDGALWFDNDKGRRLDRADHYQRDSLTSPRLAPNLEPAWQSAPGSSGSVHRRQGPLPDLAQSAMGVALLE